MEKMNEKRVAIVTGASSGIGLSTCLRLKELGYIVYGIARSENKTNDFFYYECDVTDSEKIAKIFSEIFEKEKQIEVLVNCAGFGISGSVESTNKDRAQKLFDVNLVSVTDLCKQIIPYIKRSKQGRIINISSVAGVLPLPFQSYYSASKAGIYNFSMALNNELRPFNIKVVCILPGDVKTGFTNARIKNDSENDSYKNRVITSINNQEKDEIGGMTSDYAAKIICKTITAKHPPLYRTIGNKYKIFVLLSKILPMWFVEKILYKLYAK